MIGLAYKLWVIGLGYMLWALHDGPRCPPEYVTLFVMGDVVRLYVMGDWVRLYVMGPARRTQMST